MPRRKHWRKSDSKRRERSRTDECETTVTGKYTESPGRNQARSPGRNQARSPGRNQARSPGRNQARSPGRNQARSPERMPAKSPEKKQANLEKPVHSNKSDKLVQKEKVHSKNEEFQCSDFLAHLSQRLIGELIGYPWSGVRPSASSVRPSVVRRKQFQTSSSQKPLGLSKPNFMWSLLG